MAEACPGFILEEVEIFLRGAGKNLGGAESKLKGKKNSAPPAEFDSAPAKEQTRWRAERESRTKI